MTAQIYVNWVDIGISFMLLTGMLTGIRQGVIRQAILLGSVYVSTVLAAQYYSTTGDLLDYFFRDSDPLARSFAAFALVFFLSLLAMNWLGHTVYGNTRLPILPGADLVGGAALGLVSSWLLSSVALVILNYGLHVDWVGIEPTVLLVREQMRQSFLSPMIYSNLPLFVSALRPWLPAGLPSLFSL